MCYCSSRWRAYNEIKEVRAIRDESLLCDDKDQLTDFLINMPNVKKWRSLEGQTVQVWIHMHDGQIFHFGSNNIIKLFKQAVQKAYIEWINK